MYRQPQTLQQSFALRRLHPGELPERYECCIIMGWATRVPHWPCTWMLHPIGILQWVIIYPLGQTDTPWLPIALAFLEHSALHTLTYARLYNIYQVKCYQLPEGYFVRYESHIWVTFQLIKPPLRWNYCCLMWVLHRGNCWRGVL